MRSAHRYRSPGFLLGGVVILVWIMTALVVSLIAPRGPDVQHLDQAFQPPSPTHLFGTDDLGRDVLTRVMYGARYTLTLAVAVVAVAGAGGMLLGALSGYLGGWCDEGIMRLTELVMAFPAIVLAMAIVVALGPGLVNAGLAMLVVWWPPYARLARGEVLAVRHLEFVEAAAALGQTSWGIFRRAVLPSVLPGMVILATIDVGSAIVTGSGLSFLGLGATPPTPEWGAMVSAGRGMIAEWWVATFPGLAIFVTVIAFNFMGDGIRDILDPRRRHRG
ncbi:MAG TPA: ABC transporter permease [bacterium]|nr:ABC transporter permease [bacterium]